MNESGRYQQIKSTAFNGKNVEDIEVRHPQAFENITQDRDIKGNRRPVNNKRD